MDKRKNLVCCILLTVPLLSFGQDTVPVLRLSLPQAIELGLTNRPDLQNQQLNISIAENSIARNRSQYLPVADASADLRYNTRLASTVLPEGFFGAGSSPQLIRFGTTYNSVLSVNATQNLFKAGVSQEIKISKKRVEIEQEVLKQVVSESKIEISEAYYTVLLRTQQVQIAEKMVDRLRKNIEVTTAKLGLGTIGENELNKVKLDYQNAALNLKKSRQNLQLSMQHLNNTLYLDPSQALELTDSLYSSEVSAALPDELNLLANNRSEIRQLSLEGEVTALQFKKAASNVLPTLSAYATYATQYQNNKLDVLGKNAWTPFNYVGVQVALPLFDGNATRLEKQQYRLQRKVSENAMIRQKREVTSELQTARTELMNARLNLDYARQNYSLATSIYEVNLKKYELGSLLYNDLLDIEASLTEAEKNLISETYELLLANLRWQRALGE